MLKTNTNTTADALAAPVMNSRRLRETQSRYSAGTFWKPRPVGFHESLRMQPHCEHEPV